MQASRRGQWSLQLHRVTQQTVQSSQTRQLYLNTLPETNMTPENRPSQKDSKGNLYSNHPFSGAMLVSGRVYLNEFEECRGILWFVFRPYLLLGNPSSELIIPPGGFPTLSTSNAYHEMTWCSKKPSDMNLVVTLASLKHLNILVVTCCNWSTMVTTL